jgi:hypothetical protein
MALCVFWSFSSLKVRTRRKKVLDCKLYLTSILTANILIFASCTSIYQPIVKVVTVYAQSNHESKTDM